MPGKLVIIIGVLTLTSVTVWGQRQIQGQAPQPTTRSGQGTAEVINDTIQYMDYLQGEMQDRITDTTLRGNFHSTGYIEEHWPYLLNLGYSGSPLYNPSYYVPRGAGWDVGFQAFEPYRKDFRDMVFIQNGQPITKVTYYQTPQVNQSIFSGYFARKFDDLSFALDHNRYNFTGDYLNQRSFNTIFHTGLTLDKARWYSYFLFSSEVFQQNNNGGITTDSLYFGPQRDIYENRAGYPIRFRNGISRDDQKHALAGWMLKALRFQQYEVNAGIQLDLVQRQISMNSTSSPMEFFPDFAVEGVDGINSYLKHVHALPAAIIEFSDSTKSAFTLRSLTGLRINQIQFIDQKPNWQEFVQQGDLSFHTHFLALQAHLDLRIYNNNVYFDINGDLATDWKGFEVSGHAAIKRNPAPWLFRYQNFAGTTLWNHDPPSMFTQLLGGSIGYESDRLTARIALTQQFQSNLSFLNHLGLPDTLDNQTSVLILPQLHAHLGIFHIENEVSLFASDHQLPDYPTLSGKHTLYIEDKWFKNRMHLNLGFTVYWKNEHEASYYLPFVQSFIPADHMLPAEYRIHPFFAFRVRTFKFFVRMENSNLLWQKNKILFDNYHYPLMDPTTRMGIEWIFRN
ncbi:MAG TPA: putative porin [Membranihabitans sp.]|nr:putative porin [Membranihabitans sp.]